MVLETDFSMWIMWCVSVPAQKYVQMYMMYSHTSIVVPPCTFAMCVYIYMHICAHTIYSVTVCLHINRSFLISGTAIQLNLALYSMDAYNHTTILNYTQQYYEYASEWYVCIFGLYSLRTYIYIFYIAIP